MHTIASKDGKSRVHFNGDFSGDLIFTNGKKEIRIPEDLFRALVEDYIEEKVDLADVTDKEKGRILSFFKIEI